MNSRSELRERHLSEFFAYGQRRCKAHSGGSSEHHRSTTATPGRRRKKGAPHKQESVLEPGIGEGAFSDDTVDAAITAVQATRVLPIGIAGAGAGSIPPERGRRLMRTAISHAPRAYSQ